MSRVIIKNVPKVFTEKEIVDNFRKIDEITDCKVIRSENGESRRFAFVGFKGKDTATFVSNKFNNTYLGASKIMVSIAKTKTEQD